MRSTAPLTPFRAIGCCSGGDAANSVESGSRRTSGSKHLRIGHPLAACLESGLVSINEFPLTFPQTPSVDWKHSGLGHEQGLEATRFHTRLRKVNVSLE